MAERSENAGVQNAHVTLDFFRREPRASLKQTLIGPPGVANIRKKQLFGERHHGSINGRRCPIHARSWRSGKVDGLQYQRKKCRLVTEINYPFHLRTKGR